MRAQQQRLRRPTSIVGLLLIIALIGGGLQHFIHHRKVAKSHNSAPGTYVALGDSVAAGLGLPLVTNPTTDDTLCGRSSQAYPMLVAQKLHLTLKNYACSGAITTNLSQSQTVNGTVVPSQLSQAFKVGTPDLMSITIGANEVNWSNTLRECYTSTCDTVATNTSIDRYVADLTTNLKQELTDINSMSHGKPPVVVVTGYYTLFGSKCDNLSEFITNDEISWFNDRTGKLNQAIDGVVTNFKFVHYASLNFFNHDVCADDPWIQGLTGSAPLHPTASGQAAIAQSVIAAKNLPSR